MATTEKKLKRRNGWCIALAVIMILGGCIAIHYAACGITPAENYYGNGKEWKSTDSFAEYYDSMPTLKLAEGQTSLKIMQITDAQIKFGHMTQDVETFDLLKKAIAVNRPDIVVVTGDLTLSIFARGAVEYFCDFMEEQQVYWAFVYGNHDSEYGLSKYRHSKIFHRYKYCLFDGGPSNIKGESNYFVKVVDSRGNLLYALSMIDSNMYPDVKVNSGHLLYDEVSAEQAEWYAWNVQGLRTIKSDIQSSLFMHMPFRAYADMYNDIQSGVVTKSSGFILEEGWTYTNPFSGKSTEMPGIYCQTGNISADYDGGGYALYDKIVELGCTKAVLAGHDHVNNLRGVDKNGVMLAYGRCCGYHTYPFFKDENELKWLHPFVRSLFNYTDVQMFRSKWIDPETGRMLGKGVSYLEVDLSAENYGACHMYDVAHESLSNGVVDKEYVLDF